MHRKVLSFPKNTITCGRGLWPFQLFLVERLLWNFHPLKHKKIQLQGFSNFLRHFFRYEIDWRPLKVKLRTVWLSPHSFIWYGPGLVSAKYLPGGCWMETFASNNFSASKGRFPQMWNVTRHEHVRKKRNGRVSKGGKYFRQHYLTYPLHFVLRFQLKYLTNRGT